jgi:hypothetical protein
MQCKLLLAVYTSRQGIFGKAGGMRELKTYVTNPADVFFLFYTTFEK